MQEPVQQSSAEDDSRECQSDDRQFVHDHSKDQKRQAHDAPPDAQLPTTEQAGSRNIQHF